MRSEKNAARIKRQASWDEERKDQERRRRYSNWLSRKYGLTIEQYDDMYKAQEGKCAICGTTDPGGKGSFHVDHCHGTGIVRGLLCIGCNMMLGLIKDNKETLMKAIEYISENRMAEGGKRF